MPNLLHTGLERYFTPEQRARLSAARVGVAGAGGLGSNAALMLARCGPVSYTHLTLPTKA